MRHEPSPTSHKGRAQPAPAPLRNAEIAEMLYRLAELLELEGANAFRVLAYRRAAGTIDLLPYRLAALVEHHDDLTALPHIGEEIAKQLAEICKTGRSRTLDAVVARTATETLNLSALPGIGPRRLTLLRALGIHSVKELRTAIARGDIGRLKQFGPAFEIRLKRALAAPRAVDASPAP